MKLWLVELRRYVAGVTSSVSITVEARSKADARIAAEIELPGWRAQSAQKADDGS